jgi:cyclopropane-fatty-acyl-phospholipid synthase
MKQRLARILAMGDVSLNGPHHYDMMVHNDALYKRIYREGTLGAGEAYVDGWWDCLALDEFFYRVLRHASIQDLYNNWQVARLIVKNVIKNSQSLLGSKKVAEQHYNIGNELYEKMLGPTMAYTCAYWQGADHLDQAQEQKYELICQKMGISEGDQVLELGCGWGSFAKYAAKTRGAEVTAVNISTEQMKYARAHLGDLPVSYITSDYRHIDAYNPHGKQFDKVVSIGMCEHVGYKNYQKLMQVVAAQIKQEGLFLLHTIGKNDSFHFVDPWIEKYIFPNSILPSVKRLSAAFESYFVLEDLHNFGADYDKTLMAWHDNFELHWPSMKDQYDERFRRMWRYYLLSCAGAFRARSLQLWQFVLSPKGQEDGYKSVR